MTTPHGRDLAGEKKARELIIFERTRKIAQHANEKEDDEESGSASEESGNDSEESESDSEESGSDSTISNEESRIDSTCSDTWSAEEKESSSRKITVDSLGRKKSNTKKFHSNSVN